MKALQIAAPGEARIVAVPRPEPGEDEVLVRVRAVASCPHWDITLMAGEDLFDRPGFPQYPLLPGRMGHEMCGVVEEVGANVTGLVPGQRVAAWRTMLDDRLGYYAEFAAVPADEALPAPEDLPDAAVAPLELGMCVAVSFMDMPDLRGLRFSVGGLGGAGLVAVQYARDAGAAEVIGFDPLAERRELALALGADRCLDPASDETAAWLADGRGAHVGAAIDCSGVKDSVQMQMDLAGRWVSLFGVQHATYEYHTRHAGLTVRGYGRHSREAGEYAMQRVADDRLKLAPLITRELPLSRFAEGTEMLRAREAIKILYRVGQ